MRRSFSGTSVDVVRAVLMPHRPQYFRCVLECGHEQTVHSGLPLGPRRVLRCWTCKPEVPAPSPRCDHKFVDSDHCLKCGWKPGA